MNIHQYRTVDEARALLSGNEDRIVSIHSEQTVRKQASFIRAGAFDFCGTLTTGNQWQEIKRCIWEGLRKEDDGDRDWYFNMTTHVPDTDSSLSDPDWFVKDGFHGNRAAIEGAWIARSMQRFMHANLHRKDFENAGRRLILREGTEELFDLMTACSVISMGMEQIIRACLDHHSLSAAIAATRIHFDEKGVMNGYHPNVLGAVSKATAQARFMQLAGHHVHNHLVMGDTLLDTEMMPKGAFNVWILPHTEDYGTTSAFRDMHFQMMLSRVTIVLYSNSILPLVQLIREARASAP